MNHSFKRHIAIVTGAGRGIGAATALALEKLGARVVLVARSSGQLKEVSAQASGRGAFFEVQADLSQFTEVGKIFDQVEKHWGPADILVNNAGTIEVKGILDTRMQDWDYTFDVNLKALFLSSQRFIQSHLSSPGGDACIVNISSLAGVHGLQKFEGFAAYSASKAGVIALSECLAVEGQKWGVRSNCLAPGAVGTEMLAKAAPFLTPQRFPADIAKEILDLIYTDQSGQVRELSNDNES